MSDDDHCSSKTADQHGLKCRDVSAFLLAYLERELDGEAAAEFERHLELCPPCVHYLDGYRETITLVHCCGRSELDPHAKPKQAPPEALIQAIVSAQAAQAAESAEPSE